MTNTFRSEKTLLDTFLLFQAQLHEYKTGNVITVDGETLGLPALVAAARYPWTSVKARKEEPQVVLSTDPAVRLRVEKSRDVIDSKLRAGKSIYGVNTGVGGSANTRTSDHLALSLAILQQLHIGVLPTDLYKLDPVTGAKASAALSNAMPRPWVRGAMLVRSNSLIRGHSGVRWRLIESMVDMLNKDIIPLVPVRGSISASGDLSPLSYVVGAMIGHPNVLVQSPVPAREKPSSPSETRKIMLAPESLALHGLTPITLLPKEALGVINGTSFSASVAALVALQSVDAIVLGEICTAMGTEALLGTQANYASFISEIRPHPGQIEASATLHHLLTSSSFASSTASQLEEPSIAEDAGQMRQDRYALRTAPQWIGPLIEDVMSAVRTAEIECNSTTDNPLIDPSTSQVHNGGNFQALALTTAFEKTRLALFLLGKLLFAQATELLNPAYSNGLPPNLAATDPSLNFHAKGLEVAMASYVSELGWLASNVGTHVQSAEMHNQAVNSIALISGRATLKSLEVLNMLISSYLYILCQALDLRALQSYYNASLKILLKDELATHFAKHFPDGVAPLFPLLPSILASLDATSTADAESRLELVASATTSRILDLIASSKSAMQDRDIFGSISAFRSSFAKRGAELLQDLRRSFLSGALPPSSAPGYDPSAPAGPFLGRTRTIYDYIRKTLGIRMHGLDNWNRFEGSMCSEPSIGYNISLIYEAIGDERLGAVVADLFRKHPVHWKSSSVGLVVAKL